MYHLNMEQPSQFFTLEHKTKIDLDNWDLFNCPQHWWHDVMIYMTYWPPTTQTGKVTHTTMGLHRHCSSWSPRVWTTDLFPAWHFLRNHYHDIYSWNTEHYFKTCNGTHIWQNEICHIIELSSKMMILIIISTFSHLCFINKQ